MFFFRQLTLYKEMCNLVVTLSWLFKKDYHLDLGKDVAFRYLLHSQVGLLRECRGIHFFFMTPKYINLEKG